MKTHAAILALTLLVPPLAPPRTPAAPARPTPLSIISNLLARGEGSWDSVNRGRAGDTPGGSQQAVGRSLRELTIGEVQRLQRDKLFAVGRYQFIPSTLAFAVEKSGLSTSELFSEEVQNDLLFVLLHSKRPAIWGYIADKHSDLALALDEMALEWASVAWRDGVSFYSSTGGNRASITRHEAALALNQARGVLLEGSTEASNDPANRPQGVHRRVRLS